jgi:phosphoenolpyruvate synthase/pyruvate phosphate dikinase
LFAIAILLVFLFRKEEFMQVTFGSKAETLERVAPHLTAGRVLPQVRTSVRDWKRAPQSFLAEVTAQCWGMKSLIVRSSAVDEDGDGRSLAGHYCSIAMVQGEAELSRAISDVVASFTDGGLDHEVFVQPCLTDVALSGVAFSCDPSSNAPYLVINYDRSGSTSSVTSGQTNELETCYCYRHRPETVPEHLKPVS